MTEVYLRKTATEGWNQLVDGLSLSSLPSRRFPEMRTLPAFPAQEQDEEKIRKAVVDYWVDINPDIELGNYTHPFSAAVTFLYSSPQKEGGDVLVLHPLIQVSAATRSIAGRYTHKINEDAGGMIFLSKPESKYWDVLHTIFTGLGMEGLPLAIRNFPQSLEILRHNIFSDPKSNTA